MVGFRNSGSKFSPSGGYGPGNSITIEIANLGSFLARFKQRKAGLELQTDKAVKAVADDIVITAKDLVAVGTGRTRDHIRKEVRSKHEVAVVVDRGGQRDEVPIYLEVGTFKMAARPFLVPAANLVMGAGGFNSRMRGVGGLLAPVGKLFT